ncbi:hypothetical protein K2173_013123 [Erythroxylum novogranatense]|uniref:Geranylgeranyl transferase type-2 subunit alpha n=1 Tax=Erythroxylum novogranatense TaxID=1862640 RepID=A0AAV8S778_9ROSI|nr:hypothetical protein K2173_013123 [Erythroxylum novogranatense]
MHGRPRKPFKPEDEAASVAKAQKLRALQSQFLSNHIHKNYTQEAVELSAALLEINPESYTAWNYRKLAVEYNLTHSASDPDLVKSIFDEELRLVENALRQNFKSYGAWYHRKWVLSRGHSSIEKELRLLDKFQSLDSRNFHAWNYRRFVASLMDRSEEDELKYTQSLIDKNFSNYSAWHNRSVLLANLMKKRREGFSQKDEVLTREYELVREALFTDEDDQSGWFYHLWLLDQTVKVESLLLVASWPAHGSNVAVLRESCTDGFASSSFNVLQFNSKTFPLVVYFNEAVEGVNSSTVTVSSKLNKDKDLIWKPLSSNNSRTAQVWVAQIDLPSTQLQSSEAYPFEVIIGQSQGITSVGGFSYNYATRLAFSVCLQPPRKEHTEGSVSGKIVWRDENFHAFEPCCVEPNLILPIDLLSINSEQDPKASTWQKEILDEEIKNFRELSFCKIGKLTLARLLTAYDALTSSYKLAHSEEVLKIYSDLMKLDPSHSQYYKDEYSLALLRQVTFDRESLFCRCVKYMGLSSSDDHHPICLRLHKLSLSRMGSFEKLLWVQMLDLSQNELRSIEGLEAMQLLACLNLSKNKIGSFTALGPLQQLKSLQVLDISYNEIGTHPVDTTRYLCPSPLSHSLASEWNQDDSVTSFWEAFLVLKGLKLTQLDVVGNRIADERFSQFLVKVLPALKWLDDVQLK